MGGGRVLPLRSRTGPMGVEEVTGGGGNGAGVGGDGGGGWVMVLPVLAWLQKHVANRR